MRVLAGSDFHGWLPKSEFKGEDFDVVVIAGDISPEWCPQYSHYVLFENRLRSWFRNNFSYWAKSDVFKNKDGTMKPILLVPGNHDLYLQERHQGSIGARLALPENVHVLIDQGFEYKGKTFWGSPWTKRFQSWAFMAEEETLARCFEQIPSNLDMLITHSPPYGVCDMLYSNHDTGERNYIGSKELLKQVVEKKPKVHVFGHAHLKEFNHEFRYNVNFINVGVKDVEGQLNSYSPMILEI